MPNYTLKNGAVYTIRRAQEKDAHGIIEYLGIVARETDFLLLNEASAREMTVDKEVAFIKNMLKIHNGGLFIGLVENEIVCVCNLTPLAKERIRHNASLGISIKKAFWHLGIGTATMFYLVDFARSTGAIRNICLEVHVDNVRAQALYKRFGFVEVGRHEARILINEKYYDEILMDLKL